MRSTQSLTSFILSLLFISFLSSPVSAETSRLAPKMKKIVDSTVSRFRKANKLEGVGLSIISQRRVTYVQGYGSINANAPTDIASVAKPLTAVLALKMAEEGLVDLDAPISQYLTSSTLPSGVTLRRLLSHTSGLPHYSNILKSSSFSQAALRPQALVSKPGQRYTYSSPGYVICSWVLEAAGGGEFLTLLNNKVARPAGAQSFSASRRRSYRWRLGAGGIDASPESMARFAAAILQRRLISKPSYQQMMKKQALAGGGKSDYGLGFGLGQNGKLSHNGAHPREHYYHRIVLYTKRGHGMVVQVKGTSSGARGVPGKLTTELYKKLKAAKFRF